MFQKVVILMLIFLAAIFQISAFPTIFPGGISAEIILIMAIFWTARDGFEKTWPKAVVSGAILDLFYFWPVGINIIALVGTIYGIGFLTKRFLVSHKNLGFFVFLVLIAVGTIADGIILNLLLKAYTGLNLGKISTFVVGVWDKRIFLKIIVNLCMFVIIYWPLTVVERFISLYEKKSMQGRFFK